MLECENFSSRLASFSNLGLSSNSLSLCPIYILPRSHSKLTRKKSASRFFKKNQVRPIVRGYRDSCANLMPIYGDLYQIKLWGITNENHLVTHLDFTSGRHYDVIKIAYFVSVQFKRYAHFSLWRSVLFCILFANFNRNAPNHILGGK